MDPHGSRFGLSADVVGNRRDYRGGSGSRINGGKKGDTISAVPIVRWAAKIRLGIDVNTGLDGIEPNVSHEDDRDASGVRDMPWPGVGRKYGMESSKEAGKGAEAEVTSHDVCLEIEVAVDGGE